MTRPSRGAGTQLRRPGEADGPAPDSATVSARRRFARRQRARRLLAWRPLLGLTAVLALLGGGGYLVYFSDTLAVEKVVVDGVAELRPQQVRAAAEVPIGEPLATADLTAIEYRVRSLARVRTAEATRQWPGTVRIAVTEREAVAVVRIGNRLRALDGEGVVFASYRRAPAGLPRIETAIGTGSEALAEVSSVVVSLPQALRDLVDFVEVETVDQISLRLRDGRTVRWGSAERSSQKAQVLGALLQQSATVYDVTVPEQPTVSG